MRILIITWFDMLQLRKTRIESYGWYNLSNELSNNGINSDTIISIEVETIINDNV